MDKKPNYVLVILILLPILCYVVCMFAISHSQGLSFNEVNIFGLQEEPILIKLLFKPMTVLCGLLGLFIFPGLAWLILCGEKEPIMGLKEIIYAFVASLIILEVVAFGLRNMCLSGINRADLVSAVLIVTLLGVIFGLCRGRYAHFVGIRKLNFHRIAFFTALIFAIVILFMSISDKIFIEDLNNDGHEIFWHSLHLTKSLPYTNLPEVAYLKVLPTMTFILLFGKAVNSLTIPYFFYLILIYLAASAIIYEGKRIQNRVPGFILIGHAILFTVFMFFQPGEEPYHADLTTLVADMPYLLLCLCLVYALIRKKYIFVLMSAALLLQCVHYALVILVFITVSYWIYFKEERLAVKSLLLKMTVLAITIAALFLLHSRQFGYLGSWSSAIHTELLSHFSSTHFPTKNLEFIAKYSLLVGGIPVLAIFFLRQKDKISNLVNLAALAYFLLLLSTVNKTVHTLTPIAFFPVIGFLRLSYLSEKNNFWLKFLKVSHGVILVICIVLLWPISYDLHTETRDFWSKVQFVYPKDICYIDDYIENKIKDIFKQNNLSHIFSGTWEIYSFVSNSVSPNFEYYFTDNLNEATKDIEIFAYHKGVYFLARNPSSIKYWQEKVVKTADQRYVNLLKIAQKRLAVRGRR